MARKKARSAAGKKSPKGAVVDAALKARWNEAIARYRKARDEEVEGWDERYEALGEIIDSEPPYYLAGGFKTAREFLKTEVPDQDERSVRAYIRVAERFGPKDEKKYGVWKLEALLNYLEEAGGLPLSPRKINCERQRIEVAGARGKKARREPFEKLSVQDIRAATRAAEARAGKVTKQAPPMVRAIKKLLAKGGVGEVAVRLRSGRIDLGGIRPDRLAALGRALAKAKIDDGVE